MQPAATRSGTAIDALAQPYRTLWACRYVIGRRAWQILHQKQAGSVIGLGWQILNPILMMAVYAALYILVFKISPPNLSSIDYTFNILAGLVAVISFNNAASAASASFAANEALLLNNVLPPETIPVSDVIASAVPLLVGVTVIAALKTVMGEATLAWLWLPVIVVFLTLFTVGIGWLLSLAAVALRDVQQVLGFVLMILMITSPIAYTPEMVPAALKVAMYLNPLTPFVLALQAALVHGHAPGMMQILGCAVVGVAAFHGFFAVFDMGKQIVADRV
jgi:lipopolysaccharide transport system permease protein